MFDKGAPGEAWAGCEVALPWLRFLGRRAVTLKRSSCIQAAIARIRSGWMVRGLRASAERAACMARAVS